MTTKSLPEVPAALADVAMVDGPTAATASGISISLWNQLVRDEVAPQPVMRGNRCTRWLLADVRAFLIERAKQAARNPARGEKLIQRAERASAGAARKRAEAKQAAQEGA